MEHVSLKDLTSNFIILFKTYYKVSTKGKKGKIQKKLPLQIQVI